MENMFVAANYELPVSANAMLQEVIHKAYCEAIRQGWKAFHPAFMTTFRAALPLRIATALEERDLIGLFALSAYSPQDAAATTTAKKKKRRA
jgi:hypothetical protein